MLLSRRCSLVGVLVVVVSAKANSTAQPYAGYVLCSSLFVLSGVVGVVPAFLASWMEAVAL